MPSLLNRWILPGGWSQWSRRWWWWRRGFCVRCLFCLISLSTQLLLKSKPKRMLNLPPGFPHQLTVWPAAAEKLMWALSVSYRAQCFEHTVNFVSSSMTQTVSHWHFEFAVTDLDFFTCQFAVTLSHQMFWMHCQRLTIHIFIKINIMISWIHCQWLWLIRICLIQNCFVFTVKDWNCFAEWGLDLLRFGSCLGPGLLASLSNCLRHCNIWFFPVSELLTDGMVVMMMMMMMMMVIAVFNQFSIRINDWNGSWCQLLHQSCLGPHRAEEFWMECGIGQPTSQLSAWASSVYSWIQSAESMTLVVECCRQVDSHA